MIPENPKDTKLSKMLLDNVIMSRSEDDGNSLTITAFLDLKNTRKLPPQEELEEHPDCLLDYVYSLVNDFYYQILDMAGISRDDIIKANVYQKVVESKFLSLE